MGNKCCSSAGDSGKGKGTGRARQASSNGGVAVGGGAEEVLKLKEGIRTRDIAVRLLVRELKQAGLQVPALPPGVGEGVSSSSGGGGRLLARLTGSFGHGSEAWAGGGGVGGLNDTAKQVAAAGAVGGKVGAGVKNAAGADKGAGSSGKVASGGGGCLWLRGAAAVHPEP
jgi:hypothetical protein